MTEMDDRWRVAKRQLMDEVSEQVVLVTSGDFFLQRDRNMVPTRELASKVTEAVAAQQQECPKRVIVVCLDEEHDWMRSELECIPRLQLFLMREGDVGETMVRLKHTLSELGIRFRPIRNPRAVSYLNIDKFVMGGLTVIRSDDYGTINIEPEKEVTFQDLVAKRRKNAWP